jgi:hypothetical protein
MRAWILLATLTAAAGAWAQQPAYRADSFIDFLGISATPLDCAKLGIRHCRAILKFDLTPPDQPQKFAEAYDQYGVQAMMLVDPHKDGPPEGVVALLKQYAPGVVDIVEMPNEVNNKFPPQELNLKYKNRIDEAAGAEYQRDYYAAIKADPATRGLGVLCYTAIFTDYRDARPCGAFDYSSMHSYQGSDVPESSITKNMIDFDGLLPDGGVLKPFVPSECGYNVTDDGGADGRGSARAQARNIPMLFAEYFRHGVKRTYLFHVDNIDGYGLRDSQGHERPAYGAVKEMVALLSDARWDGAAHKWVGGDGFEPRTLDFSLNGAPPTVHTLVLQKRSGDWYLLVWNELRNYAPWDRKDIVNAPAAVTLQIRTRVKPEAAVWTPTDDGGHFVQSAATVSGGRIELKVPDAVMIVRLSPAEGPPAAAAPDAPRGLTGKAVPNLNTLTWQAPARAANVAGYFVYRNWMFVGATKALTFTDQDPLIKPGLGYTYEVRAYDKSGQMSKSATTIVTTPALRPDLVITDLTCEPANPKPGDKVVFIATVKNVGQGPTPYGTIISAGFSVDGQFTSWCDNVHEPLAAGASVPLRANYGPRGTQFWTATAGGHVIKALVDDIDRIPGELSKYNNMAEHSLLVGPSTPGALIGRMGPAPNNVDLTAEGTEDWIHWGHGDKAGVNRKRGGPGLFSALTEIGSGYVDRNPGCCIETHWSDGAPTESVPDTHECLWWNCLGHGQSFSVPADTEWRTLKVWVAGLQSGCNLSAKLSDGSAPDYVSGAWSRGGEDSNIIHEQAWGACYTFRYHAASAGQKLTVSWVLVDEQNRFLGQGQLQAAALKTGGGP